jgi:hypothetical protein
MSSEKSGCGARIGMILLLIIVGVLVYFLVVKPNLKQQKITFSGIKNEILNRTSAPKAETDKKAAQTENNSNSGNGENNGNTAGNTGNNETQFVQPQSENNAERSDPAVESWY